MNEQGNDIDRVLLVTPMVFSYHVTICEALRRIGYEPTWWNDRGPGTTAAKIALRLWPSMARRWMEAGYLRRIDELPQGSIRHILIIKGEGLGSRVLRRLRERFPDASMGLYLWDSLENARGIQEVAPLYDSAATFDPVDASDNGWHYRPLFARTVALAADTGEKPQYDWCFVGTIHSDRYRVITRLRKLEGGESRSFVFAYFPSWLVLAARWLVDWSLWRAPAGELSTAPMPAADVAQVVARSRAVLDVEHPRQRGLTMRTIETLLAGRKLLSTNQHLLSCDLYHPSRAQMIDRASPQIDRGFLDTPALPIAAELRARYTCESWIGELLQHQIEARARRQGTPAAG